MSNTGKVVKNECSLGLTTNSSISRILGGVGK